MSVSRIPVKISIEDLGESRGFLIRFLSPRTVDTIVRMLPVEGRAVLWKSKVYFEIPLRIGEEKPREMVKKGDLAYWPFGRAICIFLEDMRPYTPVNLIGQITENMEVFSKVRNGVKMKLETLKLLPHNGL